MKVDFTIAAEAANARAVTIQLRQDRYLQRNLGSKRALEAYLSSDAAGLAPVDAAQADVVPTVGAAGELLRAPSAGVDKGFALLTDAAGKVDLVLTNSEDSTDQVYVNVVDPATGKVHTSGLVAFADDTP